MTLVGMDFHGLMSKFCLKCRILSNSYHHFNTAPKTIELYLVWPKLLRKNTREVILKIDKITPDPFGKKKRWYRFMFYVFQLCLKFEIILRSFSTDSSFILISQQESGKWPDKHICEVWYIKCIRANVQRGKSIFEWFENW